MSTEIPEQNGSENLEGPSSTEQTIPELDGLRAENADLKDKYLRAVAEMDNLRRRTEREKQETAKFALERVMSDLLPVLDVFETALQSTRQAQAASADVQAFAAGTEIVHKQLLSTLEKHGLARLQSLGQPFDPNLHQAIQRIDDESCTSETVAQVFAEGYLLHGRLLRAAMVAVTVPKV